MAGGLTDATAPPKSNTGVWSYCEGYILNGGPTVPVPKYPISPGFRIPASPKTRATQVKPEPTTGWASSGLASPG